MASKNSNKNQEKVGGDTIPSLPKINSLQAITRLRPKDGSQWSTFAFVLNRDILKADGTLDDLYAMVFPLGSFYERDDAEKHAKNIIEMTGHPGVIAARYGAAVQLTTKFDPEVIVDVPVDIKGRIIQLESSQYKHDKEEFEKKVRIEREVLKEAEEETDVDNIEHFKRQCYLAIKNRSSYKMHSQEAANAWENYKEREEKVRDHFRRHPEHEKNWLPYLKAKLTERGEKNLYKVMKNSYKEIREEILGISEEPIKKKEDNDQKLYDEFRKQFREELRNEIEEEIKNKNKNDIPCECGEVCEGLKTSSLIEKEDECDG
ncbi:MAG TPA: hypothetical protein VGB37_07325, partial [Candidatus Lokiarchaeia archaeon]